MQPSRKEKTMNGAITHASHVRSGVYLNHNATVLGVRSGVSLNHNQTVRKG